MLCTRCQQRDAIGPPPEKQGRIEAKLGTPWPLPTDLCAQCLSEELKKNPELRAKLKTFGKTANAKVWSEMGSALRSAIEKALDFADRIAEKLS